MKKLFELLFYCLYRMFALIKRVGEKDEELASSFYSILLSTNIILISLGLKFIIPPGFLTSYSYDLLIKITLAFIFILLYLFNKYYFVKEKRYMSIIDKYNDKYPGLNNRMALIGVLYSLLTFLSFIVLGSWISTIK